MEEKSREIEEWSDIPGSEGYYQVSSLGRCRSIYGPQPKILKCHLNKTNGYFQNVFKAGQASYVKHNIHRLVALQFIPNPFCLAEVNHIDGDKTNNSASNLEWVSREGNIQHAFAHGLIKVKKGEDHKSSIYTNEIVLSIFNSPIGPRPLSRLLNMPYSTVAMIKTGKSWAHLTGGKK